MRTAAKQTSVMHVLSVSAESSLTSQQHTSAATNPLGSSRSQTSTPVTTLCNQWKTEGVLTLWGRVDRGLVRCRFPCTRLPPWSWSQHTWSHVYVQTVSHIDAESHRAVLLSPSSNTTSPNLHTYLWSLSYNVSLSDSWQNCTASIHVNYQQNLLNDNTHKLPDSNGWTTTTHDHTKQYRVLQITNNELTDVTWLESLSQIRPTTTVQTWQITLTCLSVCKYTSIVAFECSVKYLVTKIFKHLLLTYTHTHTHTHLLYHNWLTTVSNWELQSLSHLPQTLPDALLNIRQNATFLVCGRVDKNTMQKQ